MCVLSEMGSSNSRYDTLSREQQKANDFSTGVGDSKPIKKRWDFFADITEPQSSISEVCSSNETMGVCSKFGILHADNDADGDINIEKLLQSKFCAKSGIILQCHLVKNLSWKT